MAPLHIHIDLCFKITIVPVHVFKYGDDKEKEVLTGLIAIRVLLDLAPQVRVVHKEP